MTLTDSSYSAPTAEQARQFALMLSCGAPPLEAIQYFLPDEPDQDRLSRQAQAQLVERWMKSKVVQNAILVAQGADWADLSTEARIRFAIDKHYTEMAYYLYSRNYVDLDGAAKTKADTCRVALEAKIAGTAGKLDALSQFWDDIRSGRIKLGTQPQIPNLAQPPAQQARTGASPASQVGRAEGPGPTGTE